MAAEKLINKIAADHPSRNFGSKNDRRQFLTINFSAANDRIFMIFGLLECLIKENPNIKKFLLYLPWLPNYWPARKRLGVSSKPAHAEP